MPKSSSYVAIVLMVALVLPAMRGAAQTGTTPTIQHEPVTVAVKGQSVSVLARVAPGAARLKSVTLHYAASRDASPLRLTMTPSGGGVYVATIPANHIANAPTLAYYIEAVDDQDEWAETQWHEIRVQESRPMETPLVIDHSSGTMLVEREETAATASSEPVRSGGDDEEGISTTGWIVGGALAGGAAIAIAAAGGGGGGGGGAAPPPVPGDGGGGTDTNTTTCVDQDAVATWVGVTDPVTAPGFALFSGNSAQFLENSGLNLVPGSWTLVGCDLTLFPSGTNAVYRGTGTLSDDRLSVTINGFTYQKGG